MSNQYIENIQEQTIAESEYTGNRITELPDVVLNSADELKRRFDAAAIDIISPKHNALVAATAAAVEQLYNAASEQKTAFDENSEEVTKALDALNKALEAIDKAYKEADTKAIGDHDTAEGAHSELFKAVNEAVKKIAESAKGNAENVEDHEQRLKNLEKEGGTGDKQINADWDETDETSKAFIKNKPDLPSKPEDIGAAPEKWAIQSCWSTNDTESPSYIKDRPFYKSSMRETVSPEQTITLSALSSGKYYCSLANYYSTLTNGQMCIVEWDGETYECEISGGYIGNGSLFSAEMTDTGEPFCIPVQSGTSVSMMSNVWGTHTFAVYVEEKILKTLDEEFLPIAPVEKGGTGASDQKSALKNLAAIGYMGMLTAADDLNTLTENGIYYYMTGDAPQNTPYSNASIVEVTGIPGEVRKIQRVTRYAAPNYSTYRASSADGQWTEWSCTDIEDTSYPGCFYRILDGVTEWVNPPLVDGVVYRTTKRVEGKPVYAQFKTVGKLAAAGANIQIAAGESGDEFDKVIVFDVFCTESNRRYKFPFINSSGGVSGNARFLGSRSFYIDSFGDLSGYSGMYYIEYTLK